MRVLAQRVERAGGASSSVDLITQLDWRIRLCLCFLYACIQHKHIRVFIHILMTEIIYFQLFSASNEKEKKSTSKSCNVAILFLHAKHTFGFAFIPNLHRIDKSSFHFIPLGQR